MRRSVLFFLAMVSAISGCTIGTDTCVAIVDRGADVGDPCSASEECASGVCVDGACRVSRWIGAPCGDGCDPRLVCSEGVCHGARALGPGERCDATAPEPCIDGYFCWRAEPGTTGECAPRAARGETCSENEGCRDDLLCVNFTCDDPPVAGETCASAAVCAEGFFCWDLRCAAPPTGEGDPCRAHTCPEGLFCVGYPDGCRVRLSEGERCDAYDEEPCAGGLYCNANSRACERPRAPGESCQRGDRCSDGTVCQLVDVASGTRRCDAPVPLGGFCGDGQACAPGAYCDERIHLEPSDCVYPPCP